jgi:hypothetical protein
MKNMECDEGDGIAQTYQKVKKHGYSKGESL